MVKTHLANGKAVDVCKGKILTVKEFYVYCGSCDDWDFAFDDEVSTLREFTALLRKRGWIKFRGRWVCPHCAEVTRALETCWKEELKENDA